MFALLAVVLTQAPALAVMTTRRTGASAPEGVALAAQVQAALEADGLKFTLGAEEAAKKLAELGTSDASICQGKKACVAELARQLGVKVLLSVSLGRLQADVGVSIDAVRTEDGAVLASESVLLAKTQRLESTQLSAFVQRLALALGITVTAPAPLEPKERPPEPGLLEPPPGRAPAASHAAGTVLLASAGASLVAGVVLAVLSGTSATALQAPSGTTTYREAQALANRGNAFATAAIVVGGAGLALGVGAVIAW